MDLALENACVRFGAITAFDPLSLSIPAGTHLLIFGPAGGGKTTVLKVLAGLRPLSTGTVRWASDDLSTLTDTQRADRQRRFGMVFQSDALFDSQTVLENVMLPLVKRGVPTNQATERAAEALHQVGLAHAHKKHPEELSGGMKKRAGIARAIVARPEVLLADDPFAGLDPDTERSIAELLLNVSSGRTLIAALPDPTEALPMGRTLHLRPTVER